MTTTTYSPSVIPSVSTEFIRNIAVAVGPDRDQLTTLGVSYAFTPFNDGQSIDPPSGGWVAGEWEDGSDPPTTRCLVGPVGGHVLAKGTYFVWVKLTGATEVPVRRTGTLKIS